MAFPTTEAFVAGALAIGCAVATAYSIARLGFPVPAEEKRVGCIDGLRGYLALAVMLGHSLIWVDVLRGSGKWVGVYLYPYNLGAAAVPIFFMITGLLFYPRVARGIAGTNWLSTYISRAFRILPLVTVSVAIVSLIIVLRYGIPPGYRVIEFAKATVNWIIARGESPLFRHADSGRLNAYVFWSLWYEWAFYLIILPSLASCMALMRHRLPSWSLPATFLLASLLARSLTDARLVRFLPLFAIGMIAAELRARPRLQQALSGRWAATFATACLAISGLMPSDPTSVAAIALDGVFFVAVACGNSFWGFLKWPPSLVLGECSFGIYVLHGIVLSTFFGSEWPATISTSLLPFAIPFLAVAAVSISAVAYLLIERPFIGLGARLARRLSKRPAQLSAAVLDVAP